MRKPILGETLFITDSGNRARGMKEITPRTVTVTNVARKYFQVTESGGFSIDFNIEDWREKTEYCENYQLWESLEDFYNKKESEALKKTIHQNLHFLNRLSLAELKTIAEILVKN